MELKEIINNLSNKNIKSEIYQSASESTSISFENSVFKKIESKSISGTGLRVIKNGKTGFSYSGGKDIGKIVEFAEENSLFGNNVNFDFPNQKTGTVSGLYSEDVKNLPVSELKKTGEQIIQKLNKELKGFQFDVSVEKESSAVKMLNSSGFEGDFAKTYYSVYFSVMRAKQDQIFSAYEGETTLDLENGYDAKLDNLINLCNKLDTKSKINSGVYPVVFSPKASHLIFNILTFALNGKNVQKGSSALSTEKGKKVFAKNFTLIDNPRLEKGISSVPFDGEGTPTKEKQIIENGKINGFIYDIFTAELMNEKSTGNGRRGYSSIPTPGFYNIMVEPGKQTYQEVVADIKEGIFVDEFIGGGQSNVLAGEFSVNLTLAFKIENGEIKGSLKDTMLSGNVFNVLSNSPIFCNEIFRKNNYYLPYIMFNGLSVSS